MVILEKEQDLALQAKALAQEQAQPQSSEDADSPQSQLKTGFLILQSTASAGTQWEEHFCSLSYERREVALNKAGSGGAR